MRNHRCVVALVALGLSFGGAPPQPPDDWAVVPEDVVVSLGDGGAASSEAGELAELSPRADTGELDIADIAYGPPLRLLVWGPWTEPLEPAVPGADTLTELDVSAVVGDRFLAVQYLDGRPHASLEVDERGDFVALGSYLPADVETLAEVELGTVVLGAAHLGGLDEFYRVSPDRRTVTALNTAARDTIGAQPMTIAEFRDVKARQSTAVQALEATDLPPDAVGGGGGSTSPLRLILALAAIGVGGAALFAAGLLIGRRLAGQAS